MKLSRLTLDVRHRDVRHALRDAQALHSLVMRGYPDGGGPSPREVHAVLHRVEVDPRTGTPVVYVQSATTPDWSRLPRELMADGTPPTVQDIAPSLVGLAAGDLCVFRLRANVTRKINSRTGAEGGRPNGQRVPLRDPDARIGWLKRKGEAAGFALVEGLSGEPEVRVTEDPVTRGVRATVPVTHEGVLFDGLLRVVDATLLTQAIHKGVGPAKAYGFGLLSVRRAR